MATTITVKRVVSVLLQLGDDLCNGSQVLCTSNIAYKP